MTSAYEAGHIPPVLLRHRLRIAREYAGYEQDELAELIGVSRNTIGNAEVGRVKPRRITLRAWAFHCEVPLSWIEGGEQVTHPPGGLRDAIPEADKTNSLPRLDSDQQPFGYLSDEAAMDFALCRIGGLAGDEAA
jgi:DNA-binding XRE family transcriptional regulator